MNNRIMAALFALTLCLCLFIGVVPVDAEAAECAHQQKIPVGAKSATCTEEGYGAHYECVNCRKWFHDGWSKDPMEDAGVQAIKVAALGHDFTGKRSDDTHHWNKCSRSGCTAIDEKIAHTLVDDPDDAYDAKCAVKCSVCAKIVNVDHKFEMTTTDDAEYGHKEVCSVCDRERNHAAHTWLKETDEANHTYTCEVCDYVSTDSGAHTDNNDDCKCDTCGEELAHTYEDWNTSGTAHEHLCVVCGGGRIDYGEHTFEYRSNNNGTHSKVCTVCSLSVEVEDCPVEADHICDYCEGYCKHIWSESYMVDRKKDPTCTEGGYENHAQCTVCEVRMLPSGFFTTEEAVKLAPLDHNYVWDKGDYNTEHYQWCNRSGCGNQINRGNHEFEYTDNDNGTHHLHCTVCDYEGDVYCSNNPKDDTCTCICGHAMPHDGTGLTNVPAVDPTCEDAGNVNYAVCGECEGKLVYNGTTFVPIAEEDVVIKALGHDWVWKYDNYSGLHSVKCRNCKLNDAVPHTDNDDDCLCDVAKADGTECGVLVHAHNPVKVERVAPTCVDDGCEAYWIFDGCGKQKFADSFGNAAVTDADLLIPATGEHTYGDLENEGDEHVKYCSVCNGESGRAEHIDANGDNRCDDCHFELTLDYVAEVAATCDNPGKMAHYISRVTGRKYLDAAATQYVTDADLVIEKLNHVDPTTGLGPVATDKGNGTHEFKCLLCSRVTKTESHVNSGCFCTACGASSGNHVPTTYDAKAATCDKAGHAAYVKCSCGKYYDALGNETTYKALEIKPAGHVWSEGLHNDDSAGKHYATCGNCGAKNYGEHKLTTNDPLSGNYHQMICECGEVKLEKHYDKNGDNVCDDAGCKRDLSGKKVEINNNSTTTVVTGDKETTNSSWSWLKNWIENITPSNGGGSSKAEETSKGNDSTGSSSSTSSSSSSSNDTSNETPTTSGSGNGSTGGSNDTTSTGGSNNTTAEATGVLQYIVSFFTWLFSGFGN